MEDLINKKLNLGGLNLRVEPQKRILGESASFLFHVKSQKIGWEGT